MSPALGPRFATGFDEFRAVIANPVINGGAMSLGWHQ
jgi:hypothetical protein